MSVERVIKRTDAEQALSAAFLDLAPGLPGTGDVAALRKQAFGVFENAGMPHRRVEAWKYTDLRAKLRSVPPIGTGGDLQAAKARHALMRPLTEEGSARLVFANGEVVPELSDAMPSGVRLVPLQDALADEAISQFIGAMAGKAQDDQTILALNTAFMSHGCVLMIGDNVDVSQLIEIVYLNAGDAAQSLYSRLVVIADRGAKVRLAERFAGLAGQDYLTNAVTEVHVGDGAHVTLLKVQDDAPEATHLGALYAKLKGDATFDTLCMASGAKVSRHEVSLRFDAPNSRATINGVTMTRDQAHADMTLFIDHAVPECESNCLFKNVMDDRSRAVFQGQILVRPDAQKTDGRMMAQALHLSEEAEFDAKPELEIYADDVQCGHGATSGDIDEDLLFYLMARGIPREEAEGLLVEAFLAEAIDSFADDQVIAALEDKSREWLEAGKKA